MPSPPTTGWRLFRRFAAEVAFNEAARRVRTLQRSPSLQHGIRRGMDLIAAAAGGGEVLRAGRPVVFGSVPSAQRARGLAYCPDLGGAAGAGEVVWAWVTGPNDPAGGRDCPMLVVGRDRRTLLGLLVSGQAPRRDDRDWLGVGALPWAGDTPGSVRLDRVFEVPEDGIRREGAVLDRYAFTAVAARLRADHRWE